jgi:uncharacterized membrane protein
MRGNKWKAFCLDLSFLGWAILTGIALVAVTGIIRAIAMGSSLVTTMLTDPNAMSSYSSLNGNSIGMIVVQLIISAVCSGPLIIYYEVSQAAFYERAGGLLKYADATAYPPQGPPAEGPPPTL